MRSVETRLSVDRNREGSNVAVVTPLPFERMADIGSRDGLRETRRLQRRRIQRV